MIVITIISIIGQRSEHNEYGAENCERGDELQGFDDLSKQPSPRNFSVSEFTVYATAPAHMQCYSLQACYSPQVMPQPTGHDIAHRS